MSLAQFKSSNSTYKSYSTMGLLHYKNYLSYFLTYGHFIGKEFISTIEFLTENMMH